MDRRFKERLIGAVVLAGAAVLILPAVLNGPDAPLPAPAAPGETALRTETIELERAPGSRVSEPATNPSAASTRPATESTATSTSDDSARAEAEQAPPPAPAASTSTDLAPDGQGDKSAGAPVASARASAAAPQDKAASSGAKAAPAQSPPAQANGAASTPSPAATPPPAARPAEAAGGWAVQVGTFASSSNATALASTLKARGYAAFVAPTTSGDKTLYRVRVGPTPDVESARALEKRLEKEMPAANVVRQP